MAKASDYKIITFQRQPGRRRANVTPIQPAARKQGRKILGFITTDDSCSEENAAISADKAIKELDP